MSFSYKCKDSRSEQVHYDYSNYPIYIRKSFLSGCPGYRFPSHWHDDIELTLVLSGTLQYNINGEVITLEKNEGIFVNSRQIHYGFSNDKTECEYICVLLHPLLLCVSPSFEEDFVTPLLGNACIPFIKLQETVEWQKKIIDLIISIYHSANKKTTPLMVQSIFGQIWAVLFSNTDVPSSSQKLDNNLSIVKNMIGFIQQNYTEKITLQEIATSGSVGQSKCCKLFARYLGVTPNTYLNQHRLDKSIHLLKDTDLPITQIAEEVGFNGASYYAESFRKWMGMSPTEYRNHPA